MFVKFTVNDNDFTEIIEKFVEDPVFCEQARYFDLDNADQLEEWRSVYSDMDRLRELYYQLENEDYKDALIRRELLDLLKKRWNAYIECRDDLDEDEKMYLRRDMKITLQETLRNIWHNGELVYACLGYYNKQWTF